MELKTDGNGFSAIYSKGITEEELSASLKKLYA
jgi:hypothetical protein